MFILHLNQKFNESSTTTMSIVRTFVGAGHKLTALIHRTTLQPFFHQLYNRYSTEMTTPFQ